MFSSAIYYLFVLEFFTEQHIFVATSCLRKKEVKGTVSYDFFYFLFFGFFSHLQGKWN